MNYPYACQIDIRFPTNRQAEQAIQVLQVDREPGERVVKSFSIVNAAEEEGQQTVAIMRVDLKATEAKMLRVAVSSFYDYLQVVLKTMQEFDDISAE